MMSGRVVKVGMRFYPPMVRQARCGACIKLVRGGGQETLPSQRLQLVHGSLNDVILSRLVQRDEQGAVTSHPYH